MENKWKEEEHPIWGKGGREEHANNLVKKNLGDNMFPKKIWRNGKYSIVPPCGSTFNLWEMYDGIDATRYETLEEAKKATGLI